MIDRQTHRLRYGRVTGSSTLSASTDAENESVIQGRSKLQHHVEIDPRVSGGNSMVAILPEGLEWQGDYSTSPRPNNHVRCLDDRMGVGMQWCDYPGHVEQRGAITPYKCTGVTCSNVCSEIFHKGKKKHSCTYEGGQQHHSSSNKQDGGHEVSGLTEHCKRSVAVQLVERDRSYSRAPTGSFEHHRRSGVTGVHRSEQLEVADSDVRPNREEIWGSSGGSVCRTNKCTEAQICQLEAGPRCHGDGCIQSELEPNFRICVPSILPDRTMLSKDREGPRDSGDYSTSMARTTMVCDTTRNGDMPTYSTSTRSRCDNVPTRRTTPIGRDTEPHTSDRESLRNRLITEGFSAESYTLLLESRRPGTQMAYKGPWGKWNSWCRERGINPLQASVGQIANFLTTQLHNGLEYSTLNGYRSALSAYHPDIEGHKVGQHPLIRQLLKGAFNKNPPQPRYSGTWDVNGTMVNSI